MPRLRISLAFFTILSHALFGIFGQTNKQQDICPEYFSCGNHGRLRFPFTNTTYRPCGLCAVDCRYEVAKVELGTTLSLEVEGELDGNAVRINDTALEAIIRSNSSKCDFFDKFKLLNTPSISFTVSPNLTLFSCNTDIAPFQPQTNNYFRGYASYDCPGYRLYFNYSSNDGLSDHRRSPANCLTIQVPMVSSAEGKNTTDLFSMLASEFTLQLHVSDDCLDCRRAGGRCPTDGLQFVCLGGQKGRRNLALIRGIVAVVVAVIVILALVLFFYFMRKPMPFRSMPFWKKNNTESYLNVETFLKNHGSLAPKRFTYSDIKKITNSFRTKLGQGGFGSVYKGQLQDGTIVAVKILTVSKGTGEEFINEVASISRTSHVNIVSLLGFCFQGSKRSLVYEFMANGSLEKFIYDKDPLVGRRLGWETLYSIAVGIARGLEYLHRGCNTRILHFDIKPHNILLDTNFCPKISDFGLAKLCLEKESMVSLACARGTIGYIAPEVFCRNFGGVSHKSDVYSYGMMVLEMVSGAKNTNVGTDDSSEMYFPYWIYKRLEMGEELGLHGIVDNEEANQDVRKMIIVALWCIQTDPTQRPSMSRVVEMLEGSLDSLQIPPTPFLSSSPSREEAYSSFSTLTS